MTKLFVIYGEDSFLIKKNITKISAGFGDFDKVTIDYQEQSMSEIFDEINTPSFFSSAKVISVINADFLTASSSLDKTDLKLFEIVTNEPQENIIIFSCQKEKLDSRKKYVKTLLELGKEINLNTPDYASKEKFIKSVFAKKNIQVTDEVIKVISDNAIDYGMVYQEISKIMLWNDNGELITYDKVKDLLYHKDEDNIFSLTDAIMKKDYRHSILVYRQLLCQNEEPLKILVSLANQIRLMLQVKLLLDEKLSEKDIASQLAIHPYRVTLASNSCKLFTTDELINKLNVLADIDNDFKLGKVNITDALELFLIS